MNSDVKKVTILDGVDDDAKIAELFKNIYRCNQFTSQHAYELFVKQQSEIVGTDEY
jgi:hypothetical protein